MVSMGMLITLSCTNDQARSKGWAGKASGKGWAGKERQCKERKEATSYPPYIVYHDRYHHHKPNARVCQQDKL